MKKTTAGVLLGNREEFGFGHESPSRDVELALGHLCLRSREVQHGNTILDFSYTLSCKIGLGSPAE